MKNNLEKLRAERSISQTELANVLEVSRQLISSLENGKYNPSIVLAFKIVKYFDKTIEEIFIYGNDEDEYEFLDRKMKWVKTYTSGSSLILVNFCLDSLNVDIGQFWQITLNTLEAIVVMVTTHFLLYRNDTVLKRYKLQKLMKDMNIERKSSY